MTVSSLPSALDGLANILEQIGDRGVALFLDFDGTLAPIVARPELAELPAATRQLLATLGRKHLVCVLSGRGLEDLHGKVGIPHLYYASDHGCRIAGPTGTGVYHEVGGDMQEDLESAACVLSGRLANVPGIVVENKVLSVSVHYRLVAEEERTSVADTVAEVISRFPRLRLASGKLVHELRPNHEWGKGHAMLWLLERLDLNRATICPVCLGDDLTDEDTFRAAAGWGVSVIVGEPDRETLARYRLADTVETPRFLSALEAGLSRSLHG